MRIAIDARKIADFGIGTYIRGLLGGLARIGGTDQYVILAPRDAEGIPSGFEHVVVDSPHYSVRELMQVGWEARRAGASLIHAPHYVLPFSPLPAVVTIHDLIHLRTRHRNPLASIYARSMIGRAVRTSQRVLTVSAAVKEDILATFRCDPEKVVVTSNGVDDFFREAIPNPSPSRYFLYVGNDKPHKNVERMVEAFSRVRSTAPDLRLVMAGARFARFAPRAGIVTAGFVSRDELRKLYRGALALLQPSLDEGFGLPAAEAMASGTAVIASSAPALVEVTGDAALHVDALSVESIAAAMEQLAADDLLRIALGNRGVERARAMTWKRCAEVTRQVYLDVLGITK